MLPSTESKRDGQSPHELDEKNVALKNPTEGEKEEKAQLGTFPSERVNVDNREGAAVSDEDSNTSPTNIFADPAVAAHYASVYEKSQYECRHVFDPELEWTKKEEKRVIRKLDWHGKSPPQKPKRPSSK
jgi:hypothetical protein